MGCSKSSSRRISQWYGLPPETRKFSSKQPNLPPKKLEEQKQIKLSQQKVGNDKEKE